VAHTENRVIDVFLLKQSADGSSVRTTPRDGAKGRADINYQSLKAIGLPIPVFSRALSGSAKRPVIDETSLPDFLVSFDFNWSNDADLARAVKEQLGLELQLVKRPTEMLVIEHIERWPSSRGGK
jgi:uncharacterized protein (TIGR03435 family)